MTKQKPRGGIKPRLNPESREAAKGSVVVQERPDAGAGKRRSPGRSPASRPDDERPLTDLLNEPDNTLLTVEQTRRILAISDWFTRRLIRDRSLPAILIAPNCIRVKVGALREFIDSRDTSQDKPKGK